jgi:hypothetical protein
VLNLSIARHDVDAPQHRGILMTTFARAGGGWLPSGPFFFYSLQDNEPQSTQRYGTWFLVEDFSIISASSAVKNQF